MKQTFFMKVMSNEDEGAMISSLYSYRLILTRIVLLTTLILFIFAKTVFPTVVGNYSNAEIILMSIFAALGILLLVLAYVKPKESLFMFYIVPLYFLICAKIIETNIANNFEDIFFLIYMIIIFVNYILCQSPIALAYSILAIFCAATVFTQYGSDSADLDKHWVYAITLIAEVIIGFFILSKFEIFMRKEEKRQYSDELTGLLNKQGFLKELKKAVIHENQFFLVLTDIHKFREVTEILEMSRIDDIIRSVASNLANFPESFAHARFYNDKFAFISRAHNSLILNAQLNEFEKLIRTVSDKHSLDSSILFSTGAVFYPEQASNPDQLFDFAELSLSKSKTSLYDYEKGANSFFAYEYLDEKKRIFTIQKDFLTACRNGELQVFYQPKISLITKKITGMEALSRWTHPDVGYISPDEFVDIAEKSGHIIALGEYVIESSLYHIKQVHKICSDDITISINISPIQLLQKNFTENIFAKAANFGVDPACIYLEITEGTILKKKAHDIIVHLKDMGFNLSLDDFGTGYSSLSYLHKYNFDELKIDKSFSDGLMRGRNERQLFKFLLTLAKELGMKTVTEGVEDDVQIKLLHGLGADEIQGWYYSKALSSFDCIEYVKSFKFEDYDKESNGF